MMTMKIMMMKTMMTLVVVITLLERVLTFLSHSDPEALPQSTVSALVPFVLVDNAAAVETTRVHVVLTNTPPKEPLASVA